MLTSRLDAMRLPYLRCPMCGDVILIYQGSSATVFLEADTQDAGEHEVLEDQWTASDT